jgi:hypothetical protein
MRVTIGMLALLASGCAGGLFGSPKDNVSLAYDKFTGKRSLRATIDKIYTNEDTLALERQEQDSSVVLTWRAKQSPGYVVPLAQRIEFDLAADEKPVLHSAPERQLTVVSLDLAELVVSVRVTVEEFQKIASASSIDARVCGQEKKLGDFDRDVIREFARRLSNPN